MPKAKKIIRHKPDQGWALTVGGPVPYVGDFFPCAGDPHAQTKAELLVTQDFHTARLAVVLTLADYRRLLRAAKGGTDHA